MIISLTASGRRRYSLLHVVGVLVLGVHHLVVEAPLAAPDRVIHLLLRGFRGKQVAGNFPAVERIIWRLYELVVVLVALVG